MPKLKDCFKVEGVRWEKQSTDGIWAIHIEIPSMAHVCCWAYAEKDQYYVQRYHVGVYAGDAEGQWLGPMEAMCVVLEAQKEAAELASKSTT